MFPGDPFQPTLYVEAGGQIPTPTTAVGISYILRVLAAWTMDILCTQYGMTMYNRFRGVHDLVSKLTPPSHTTVLYFFET